MSDGAAGFARKTVGELQAKTKAGWGRAVTGASRKVPGAKTVRRPAAKAWGDRRSPAFDLTYTRVGPRTSAPAVVIPGGPGLASMLPYAGFRRRAAKDGLDIIMIDHRGVGASRKDLAGADLPHSAMWVDYVVQDIAAVLDAEGVEAAYFAGSSYGSYLASRFAAAHPQRVRGLLLDSTLHSPQDVDIERDAIRQTFLAEDERVAAGVQQLIAQGDNERVLMDVLRAAHELVGPELVQRLVTRRTHGQADLAWQAIASYVKRDPSLVGVPGFYEFANAGAIGFRELNYGATTDGGPLDPVLSYAPLADQFPGYEGEPTDLVGALSDFTFPVLLLVGDRDLRTPAAIAQRAADLLPNATVVHLENGHGALETHSKVFEKALKLLVTGQLDRSPELQDDQHKFPLRGFGAPFIKYVQALDRVQAATLG